MQFFILLSIISLFQLFFTRSDHSFIIHWRNSVIQKRVVEHSLAPHLSTERVLS